jgi:formamidopyrimidine-DNA glycosylase
LSGYEKENKTMIELPEAVVLAQQVTSTLAGKRIVNAVANQSPHKFAWYSGDPANYPNLLAGKTIRDAAAFGNHVEIHADDRVLVISTPIHFHPAGEALPKKHQLLLELEDRSALTCTIQMWGGLFCFPEGENGGMPDYHIAKQKPSPLTEAFDRAFFDSLFDENTPGLSAKAFLATEQRISGLGNGVLQDILWTAKIHPKCKMANLSKSEQQKMFAAVKSVLQEMAAQGGRDTESDLFGHPGGYKTILSKFTVGQPCPACASIILKEPYLGGSFYYCPGCQKM